jgi:hypothetical protein
MIEENVSFSGYLESSASTGWAYSIPLFIGGWTAYELYNSVTTEDD